ncbi:MAG TPA: radical SAM protein, partial [Bdellovibrionota bacterium]|nr:radical SAM protein [Bdellovibrionota bacterium]
MKYVVRTLGCKANLYDSQLMEATLREMGMEPAGEGETADVCVVNSCTVTNEAEKQSRDAARRLAKTHPGTRVVMTGCSVEVDPQALAKVAGVDYVLSNRDKPRFGALLGAALSGPTSGQVDPSAPVADILGDARGYEQLLSKHPMDREWPLPEALSFLSSEDRREDSHMSSAARTRVFLKIQEGCDSFCTFCIIPYGRGPGRSLRVGDLVGQVERLCAAGAREVVLTGTNIGQYGMDWSEDKSLRLEELCRALLERTSIERLRVSSLDPVEITPGLLGLMESDPRFCPHFHVSLQSPHPKILRLMKRKYGAAEVRSALESIAGLRTNPAPFVGMDVITGFPGETREEFEWGLGVLDSLPWSRLHVFPYSERKGTPATRLPGSVERGERLRRAEALRALS